MFQYWKYFHRVIIDYWLLLTFKCVLLQCRIHFPVSFSLIDFQRKYIITIMVDLGKASSSHIWDSYLARMKSTASIILFFWSYYVFLFLKGYLNVVISVKTELWIFVKFLSDRKNPRFTIPVKNTMIRITPKTVPLHRTSKYTYF